MKRLMGSNDPLMWARSPSPAHEKNGFQSSAWEKAIVDLASAGDSRFVEILREHIDAGVIRSERAKTVIGGGESGA